METVQLNISNLPVELRDSLRAIAEVEKRSMQAQIVYMLEGAVKEYNAAK